MAYEQQTFISQSSRDWEVFPDSSVGKESACNAGDPGLIPGSGRSTEEGIGYPLQYSWVFLAAQLVKKKMPAIWETWVRSLGWEDLEKGTAAHLQNSGLGNSMACVVHVVAQSLTERLSLSDWKV